MVTIAFPVAEDKPTEKQITQIRKCLSIEGGNFFTSSPHDHYQRPAAAGGLPSASCGTKERPANGSGPRLAGRQARIQNRSNYFAFPVVGDGKIYVAGENGVIVVLENSTNYKLLVEHDMGAAILATPAVAAGKLLIRSCSQLTGVAEKQSGLSI